MANKKEAGIMLAGGAALALAITLVNQSRARAAPGEQGPITLDEATMQLLVAMAQNGADIAELMQKIIEGDSAGQPVINVRGYPENADSIEAGRIVIDTLDQWYQLPPIPVPDGMTLLLKGAPTNGATVYVAKSRNAVTNINQAWPLLANENVRYAVKNAEAIFVAGITGTSAVGEALCYTVETRQGGA